MSTYSNNVSLSAYFSLEAFETNILEQGIRSLTPRESNIKNLIDSAFNAIKAIFGCSDYQRAVYILSGRIEGKNKNDVAQILIQDVANKVLKARENNDFRNCVYTVPMKLIESRLSNAECIKADILYPSFNEDAFFYTFYTDPEETKILRQGVSGYLDSDLTIYNLYTTYINNVKELAGIPSDRQKAIDLLESKLKVTEGISEAPTLEPTFDAATHLVEIFTIRKFSSLHGTHNNLATKSLMSLYPRHIRWLIQNHSYFLKPENIEQLLTNFRVEIKRD